MRLTFIRLPDADLFVTTPRGAEFVVVVDAALSEIPLVDSTCFNKSAFDGSRFKALVVLNKNTFDL